MRSRCSKITSRFLTVMLCAGILAGCAQAPRDSSSANWHSSVPATSGMAPELNQFLHTAVDQSTAFFEQTPWGNQAEVSVISRYYSGSGRECLRLQVSPAAVATKVAIACEQNGQWVSVRPITQMLTR